MSFAGFLENDFDVFHIDGLESRMEGIRTQIQPKFKKIGEAILNDTSLLAGHEMFVHIAQHARRKVNAPVDTWMAFCENKRGYKQYPHFQIGLFDDRVFVWLALIYELPSKRKIAETYLEHLPDLLRHIPDHFEISPDHMKKDSFRVSDLGEQGVRDLLERFRDVNKAELLIGRTFARTDPQVHRAAFLDTVKDTFSTLAPLYGMARS
ncbi:DUF1054 domain-containing protein [Paenibacillus hodogayensis]|uniref:UPF0637 protein ACFFNY_00560 n=1 Tax=Paenibacillus hodogayensis TaxID=279208 RepID=A0ABV5VPG2_9BACL